MEKVGVCQREVSVRTVQRFLLEHGYHYLQARKKDLSKESDLTLRVAFTNIMKKKNVPETYARKISHFILMLSVFITRQIQQNRHAQLMEEFGVKKAKECTLAGEVPRGDAKSI